MAITAPPNAGLDQRCLKFSPSSLSQPLAGSVTLRAQSAARLQICVADQGRAGFSGSSDQASLAGLGFFSGHEYSFGYCKEDNTAPFRCPQETLAWHCWRSPQMVRMIWSSMFLPDNWWPPSQAHSKGSFRVMARPSLAATPSI